MMMITDSSSSSSLFDLLAVSLLPTCPLPPPPSSSSIASNTIATTTTSNIVVQPSTTTTTALSIISPQLSATAAVAAAAASAAAAAANTTATTLVMYPSGGAAGGGRPLRAGYGFPGESAPASYPIVGGMHPGSVFGGNPQLKQREISFDTSSKEPHLIRARVFVGNMNTNAITRDDIIRLFSAYGTLLGVTLFKGYAFIQYANPNEADLAVNVLNGYNWNGSVLDVKLAIAGMKSHNTTTVASTNGVKRGAESWPTGSANTKKERIDECTAPTQNERNRNVASVDITNNTNLYQSGMPDTMICGCCRFVTSDFEQFREHRKAPCANISITARKERTWQCSMCQEVCDDAAMLIEHALERHNIRLMKMTEQ